VHLRVARAGALRRLILAFAALCVAAGCGPPSRSATVSVSLHPRPPVAGTATMARIALRFADHQPVPATNVRVEAHMTHPGMAPVLPDAVRVGDGEYEARIEFPMAGDWLIAVTGDLPDGQRFTLQAPVAGVKPAAH
jgi:hypothetical protein